LSGWIDFTSDVGFGKSAQLAISTQQSALSKRQGKGRQRLSKENAVGMISHAGEVQWRRPKKLALASPARTNKRLSNNARCILSSANGLEAVTGFSSGSIL